MFELLAPLRDAAIIGRLRSAHLLPIPRMSYLQVSIIYTLGLRFNPLPSKVKMNHHSLSLQ